MRFLVWNLKGGQGKTVLSLNLAMLRNAYVITNDVHSPIDEVLGEDKALRLLPDDPLPEVPADIDLFFDFGGYPDVRTIEVAKLVDWIIVPIIYDSPLEMQVTLNALKEIQEYNSNIIVIANRSGVGDKDRVQRVLSEFGYDYPVFEVKKSTAFTKSMEEKKSIKQLVDDYAIWRAPFSIPLSQLEHLLDLIYN